MQRAPRSPLQPLRTPAAALAVLLATATLLAQGADPPPSGPTPGTAVPSGGHVGGPPDGSVYLVPTASARPGAPEGAVVRVRDRKIFEIRVGRGDSKPSERAQRTTRVLEALVEERDEPEVRVVQEGDTAVIYAGKTPVIQLTEADAQAAGDTSLGVHAASVAARIRRELSGERQRHQLAQGVFSLSLLVFSGLISLLLVRKLGELAERLRERLQRAEEEPRLQLRGIDVLPPGVAAGSLAVALGAGRVLVQVAVGYVWLAFALSLFESTKGYTARLTSALVEPLSGLLQRLVTAAPLVVVVGATGFVLLVLLRFVRVFFRGLAEGKAEVRGLPADLAGATGVLAQLALVVVALVAVLPLVTGSDQGAAGKLGLMALGALGLGATPLVASLAVGAVQIYSRRLARGDAVELGASKGRVLRVGLLETLVESEQGQLIHVPHLLTLMHPTRIQRGPRVIEVRIPVDAGADQPRARAALEEAARRRGDLIDVQLEAIDAGAALYRVRLRFDPEVAAGDVLLELAEELRKRSIKLGQRRGGDAQ